MVKNKGQITDSKNIIEKTQRKVCFNHSNKNGTEGIRNT